MYQKLIYQTGFWLPLERWPESTTGKWASLGDEREGEKGEKDLKEKEKRCKE